jgi:hypothetical protein
VIREIKRYRITCDHCFDHAVNVETTFDPPGLPEGWSVLDVGPCGMTGYYRQEWWCLGCVQKVSGKLPVVGEDVGGFGKVLRTTPIEKL